MNEITLVKNLSGEENFVQKSDYRSIIYCFKGELHALFRGKETIVGGGQAFVFASEEVNCKCVGNTVAYYMEIKYGNFQIPSAIINDGETLPILFCFKEALRYYEKGSSAVILEGLGTLIAGYLGAFSEKGKGVTEEIKNAINENIGNADFCLSEYLKSLTFSENYVKKVFKNQTGCTPKEYLIKQRLNKARVILSGADRLKYTVKEVSSLCGYKDPLYFSRLFKKRFSLSPLAYSHRFDKPDQKRTPVGSLVENDV